MNLSASIMLVNKAVRPVKVEYDPDTYKNNNPHTRFMTFDPDVKKDDLVIVPTHTRHKFTIAKVTEVDFAVDFHANDEWGWVGGKFDKTQYDEILAQEKTIRDRIAKGQENKMRKELAEAMGLGDVDFTDLDIMKTPAIPAPAQTHPSLAPVTEPADPGLPAEAPGT